MKQTYKLFLVLLFTVEAKASCIETILNKYEIDVSTSLVKCALFSQNPNRFIYGMIRGNEPQYSIIEVSEGLKLLDLCDKFSKKINKELKKCN